MTNTFTYNVVHTKYNITIFRIIPLYVSSLKTIKPILNKFTGNKQGSNEQFSLLSVHL